MQKNKGQNIEKVIILQWFIDKSTWLTQGSIQTANVCKMCENVY